MVAKCKECQNEVYVADRFRHCFTGYCYKCDVKREDSDFVIDDMGYVGFKQRNITNNTKIKTIV